LGDVDGFHDMANPLARVNDLPNSKDEQKNNQHRFPPSLERVHARLQREHDEQPEDEIDFEVIAARLGERDQAEPVAEKRNAATKPGEEQEKADLERRLPAFGNQPENDKAAGHNGLREEAAGMGEVGFVRRIAVDRRD